MVEVAEIFSRELATLSGTVNGPEPEFVKVLRAQESIARNRFRQPICILAGRYFK